APAMVDVAALDANDNTVPGYTGTVHFSSTDLAASLPNDYTFTAADGGAHLFAVTFGSAGKFTLAVTDAAHPAIVGAAPVFVHWAWYYNPYAYPYSYGGFVGYPAVSVITQPMTTVASPSVTTAFNPIGNIGYGASPFGSVANFSTTDPIANIS